MFHFIKRCLFSAWNTLGIVTMFAAWCILPILAGAPDAAFAVMAFVLIFFAPVTWMQAWDNFGD